MTKNKASRVLTRETVVGEGPCSYYRNRFIERFPDSVEVTVELAVSQSEDWDWWWAAERLLTREGYKTFVSKNDELEEILLQRVRPYRQLLNEAYTAYYAEFDRLFAENTAGTWAGDDRAYEIAREGAKHLIEVPQAARDTVEDLNIKRLAEGRARIWAEIFISETDKDFQENKNDPGCLCEYCVADREAAEDND